MAETSKGRHGEGSVFQRKDGRWVAQFYLETGKKKCLYRKTEKEARAALRKVLHEQEQGTLVTGPQQTLKVYLEQWLEQVHRPTVRLSTYNLYRIVLHKHLIPCLGHIQLQRLTPQHVQAFYASKLKGGLSAKRVRAFHSVLHTALDNAVKWNLIARNVCDVVTPPVPKRHEIQPLDQEQAKRFLQVVQEHKLEALLTVALMTGMRRGELLGLHWQDIDVATGSLQVRRSVNRVSGFGLIESEPKTAKSRRKIMLPHFALEALQRHRIQQQEVREKAGSQWNEQDIVFCNTYGGYMESSNLHNDFKRILKEAKLPNIRLHDLRHSTATLLLGMGVNPKIVQELLGHSNISMTMDVYSHVLPSMQQEAMGKLDDLFRQ
ncbi:MAG: tyrosine-type recombinase/integrase [Ktedonobacteraceae bacterium]|nr:tyrosine-type recombinase/integrase [Ktedonobacteraceae bacterium]